MYFTYFAAGVKKTYQDNVRKFIAINLSVQIPSVRSCVGFLIILKSE